MVLLYIKIQSHNPSAAIMIFWPTLASMVSGLIHMTWKAILRKRVCISLGADTAFCRVPARAFSMESRPSDIIGANARHVMATAESAHGHMLPHNVDLIELQSRGRGSDIQVLFWFYHLSSTYERLTHVEVLTGTGCRSPPKLFRSKRALGPGCGSIH